jgi:hypothetical protein
MAASKPEEDHIEASAAPDPSVSTSGSAEKTLTNLENDPHRAALEDNPSEPERITFMKGLAIFVSTRWT